MDSEITRARAARDLLEKIVTMTRLTQGDQAHRIMPHLWPLLCEAEKMFPTTKDKERDDD